MSIYDWTTTPGGNASADSAIDWNEGQPPSSVNNSARAMMGRVAEWVKDLGGNVTIGGSANAILATINADVTALATGMVFAFKATATNTSAVTINVNGTGAKAIRKFTDAGEIALAANDIRQHGRFLLVYDAAANSAAGAWIIINPLASWVPLAGGTVAGDLTVNGAVRTDHVVAASGGTLDYDAGVHRFRSADGSAIVLTAFPGGAVFPGSVTADGNIFAGNAATPGVELRPNGAASTAGRMTVSGAGNVAVDGTLAVGSNIIASTGGMVLRPNGIGSTSNQVVITGSTGSMTVAGPLLSLDSVFGGNGALYLRPNGTGSTVGQVTIGSTGNLTVHPNGVLVSDGVYGNTTSAAANVHISSTGGVFYRSTSSGKYKTDIQDLDVEHRDLIMQLRPVWYRSTCENDRKDWSWYGLIAEEVAAVDPRLVFWRTEETMRDPETGEQVVTPLAKPVPEGVMYDRLVAHLIAKCQQHDAEIEGLKRLVAGA